MTQDQEIREAIGYLTDNEEIELLHQDTRTHFDVIFDLAKRYLSCSSMMPEKKYPESVPAHSFRASNRARV